MKSKKIRVLHILNSSKYSGAENVVINIMENTKSDCESAYLSPVGSIGSYLNERGLTYIHVDNLSISNIKKEMKEFRPQIIHAHDFRAGILTVLTGTKLPIINHLHNNSPWMKRYGIYSFVYGICAMRLNQILTVSDSVMNEYVFGNLLKRRSLTIGNPFDADKVRKMAGKADLQKQSDIIFLGRLSPPKRPFFFLEIVKEIKKVMPAIKISVVGEGELKQKFRQAIKEMGLTDNVKTYGFLDNPYGLLKNAKVMCMPSAWEGFGLAAVEALTLGVPVVCSGAGGLSGIVSEKNGKICYDNISDYVAEIVKLLTDESYWNAKSTGATKASIKFDNSKMYNKKILEIYRNLYSI